MNQLLQLEVEFQTKIEEMYLFQKQTKASEPPVSSLPTLIKAFSLISKF